MNSAHSFTEGAEVPATPLKEKTAEENCAHCGVPNDLHGTCCGWSNATHPCSVAGVITDNRHPGFGQPLNLWIHTFYDFHSSADACDISQASGYGHGWKNGIAYAEQVATARTEALQEELKRSEEAVEIITDKWSRVCISNEQLKAENERLMELFADVYIQLSRHTPSVNSVMYPMWADTRDRVKSVLQRKVKPN